jgi:CRISPR-associated protein Csd2
MGEFTNKIDFAALVMVKNANPNGDPLNGNRPRETYDGYGEISDVCIKRKIRNRLQDMGESIFMQSDDRTDDGCKSLAERVKKSEELKKAGKAKDRETYARVACEKWIDVRSFGQVFAFKDDSVSVGVRGPVSVHSAFSVLPVSVDSMQITKSVNSETKEGKSSDTMGMKHTICSALYVIKGSINHQLAEKTGFSDEDAEKIKEALRTLFVNDSSSARPDGSMEVCKLYWWKHNCATGQYSSAKVHRLLEVKAKVDDPKEFADYEVVLNTLPDLKVEEIEGI